MNFLGTDKTIDFLNDIKSLTSYLPVWLTEWLTDSLNICDWLTDWVVGCLVYGQLPTSGLEIKKIPSCLLATIKDQMVAKCKNAVAR